MGKILPSEIQRWVTTATGTARRLDHWSTSRTERSAVRHPRGHPDLAGHLPDPDLVASRTSVWGGRPRPRPRPRLLATRRRVRLQVRDGPHGPRPDHHHAEVPP